MKPRQKPSVVIVYTGDGKGKTSASIGLVVRALGVGWRVAFVQFIKSWTVSEHKFFAKIQPLFGDQFVFYKGGKGFVNLGEHSAHDKKSGAEISFTEHRRAAQETLNFAQTCVSSGKFDLVVCDEINNAVVEKLITTDDLRALLDARNRKTSLCLTGRNWPAELNDRADIITNMTKTKHHFDEGFLANVGIDY